MRRYWLVLVFGLLIVVNGYQASGQSPSDDNTLDDSLIAFVSNRGGDLRSYDIYVMKADGSSVRNITNSPELKEFAPAWSPDGTKIAFTAVRGDEQANIYIMDINGADLNKLTNGSSASWSPDGKKIAFTSNRDGNLEVYVINLDGTGLVNLTNYERDDFDPNWSPDGEHIAFTRELPYDLEIYVMDVDGSNQMNLSADLSDDFDPAWSPDGTKIAFVSQRDGNPEIYVMNTDGSNQTNLTHTQYIKEQYPTWSPDGTKIAFDQTFYNWEVYVMNADGTNPINLTNCDASDGSASWSNWLEDIPALLETIHPEADGNCAE